MTEKIIGVLALVALCGVIALSILGKDTQVIIPVLTILIGYLVGRKQEAMIGGVRKILKK